MVKVSCLQPLFPTAKHLSSCKINSTCTKAPLKYCALLNVTINLLITLSIIDNYNLLTTDAFFVTWSDVVITWFCHPISVHILKIFSKLYLLFFIKDKI